MGTIYRTMKGLPSWRAGSSFSPSHRANYFSPKIYYIPCNSIRQEGSPKLSLEQANYLLIAPSDFHLMNRVRMEENASHKETQAREPMSITPLDISHSSAVPEAAGAVSRCLGMRAGGCRRSPFPPLSLQRNQWVGGRVCGELVRGLLNAMKTASSWKRGSRFSTS